jgi:RNA polymerase sigma factor (sigma-70 family)
MTEYSDQEIIECLRNRKSYVVRYLFKQYLPMIRLMVYKMGGTGEDAKDIFQDALLIMLQKIDSKEFVLSCKFKTFLYSVCENLWRNIVKNRLASANYLEKTIDDYTGQDFTEIYDNKLYEHLFYDMFKTLDPRCQIILKLYWKDFSPKEIAEKLGYAYSYVRKKKCECQGELITKVRNHPEFKAIQKTQESAKTIIYD